jgi:hypothetical protein
MLRVGCMRELMREEVGEGGGWGGGGAPYKSPSIPLHQQQLRGTSTGPIRAPLHVFVPEQVMGSAVSLYGAPAEMGGSSNVTTRHARHVAPSNG